MSIGWQRQQVQKKRIQRPSIPKPITTAGVTAVNSLEKSEKHSHLPVYASNRGLRQTAVLNLQQQVGNTQVQRLLQTPGSEHPVQRCGGEVHAGCGCAAEEEQRAGGKTADSVIQRDDEAPIDAQSDEDFQLQVNRDLIRSSLDLVRGRHRFSGRVGLSNPVSLALDALDINPGFDPSQLQASLSYNNACNEALQSALLNFSAGPFINVDRIPWQARASTGIRIGSLRLEPGIGLNFQGSDFDSLLFTVNLAHASRAIPPECIAPPSRTPESPGEDTTGEPPTGGGEPPTTKDRPPTEVPTTLPTYTLYFFYDSTLIRPESHDHFQRVVELLQFVPSLVVHLSGHASLEGSDSYNQTLSEERVQAMKNRLIMGQIDPTRIHTLALGESVPAVTEPDNPNRSLHPTTERIRTLNRRVEVRFFDPSGQFESAPLELPEAELRTPGALRQ